MIILTSRYPTKAQADAINYALAGKARNVTSSGDGTGTPLEKDWLNDLFGWQQALMAQAGLSPNGVVETQIASQLLLATQIIAQQRTIAAYQFGTSSVANAALFPITLSTEHGGFSLSSNRVQVPAIGKYRVGVFGLVLSSSTSNPSSVVASLDVAPSSTYLFTSAPRPTAVAGDSIAISYEAIVDISNPATQTIGVKNQSGVNASFSSITNAYSNLIIERVL